MAVRYLNTNFWEDTKVQEKATPEDRYFMLYLLTNPHTNQLGCYEISKKLMSYETGYNIDTINHLLERINNSLNFAIYDDSTNEVLIINWGKYNWTMSPKVKANVFEDIEKIKSAVLFENIKKNIGYVYGMDSLSQIKEKKIKENENKEKENKKEKDIYTLFEEEFGRTISPIEYETIAQMVSDYSEDFVKKALSEAVLNKALSIKYISKILVNWQKNGLNSIKQVEDYLENYWSKKEKNKEELEWV